MTAQSVILPLPSDHDHLLHFVTPVDGAYYFAPSEELLGQVLESA